MRSGLGREVHDGTREGQLAQQEVTNLQHTGGRQLVHHEACMWSTMYGITAHYIEMHGKHHSTQKFIFTLHLTSTTVH